MKTTVKFTKENTADLTTGQRRWANRLFPQLEIDENSVHETEVAITARVLKAAAKYRG